MYYLPMSNIVSLQKMNKPNGTNSFFKSCFRTAFIRTSITYLMNKKWKELIELYMLEKTTVDMIHPLHLKAVEQADRSLVLPLYHQTIMYYIEQKSERIRTSNQTFTKTTAHYCALKQMPRWETYIATLAEQTKRLRAFQDLLRKGKFI